ncbi:hypothetical protein LMH87_000288 [Akanthomyces muscarius]|uniref:Calponin-homology (CH) domain-containing protein n=1 Tax=Akanthomyces muscarius TaxID=2231603 RepID=A0A9W8QE89_AKAMU|nr:hypothetical protein LMH87_000288 [Akanthomyces muscarius]KAJ4155022.1 hypothetical protein LMH87_000288 [Akanthomyces muscarius]
MASVSSLDKDLRKMRLDKYTPAAANEARTWVEESLGEKLSSSDLLEGLKDGVALCKLINLAIPPPGIKFKQSAMPFVQMENISHFLRACQSPPLNLHEHDIFLTVDLYEQKDPAQVLQCLGAFSRAAHGVNPQRFPSAIGPRSHPGGGPSTPGGLRGRGASITSNTSSAYSNTNRSNMLPSRTGDSASGRWSPTKSPTRDTGSPGPVSTWSSKQQENASTPAWNISQYGYMGGASQGNLGIQFGGRRQIINSGPRVPSLAEKERMRKDQAAEEERQRQEEEERERERLAAEEAQAKREEEERWEAETRRLRQKADDERRRWEEEERQWKLTEERRKKEEAEAEAKVEEERQRARSRSPVKLRGQYLSQHQAADRAVSGDATDDSSRIKALEKELEKARQREAEYERERQGRGSNRSSVISGAGAFKSPSVGTKSPKARSRSRPRAAAPVQSPPMRQDSWAQGEREYLQTQWSQQQQQQQQQSPTPEPVRRAPEHIQHQRTPEPPAPAVRSPPPPQSPRPLPDPTATTPQVKSHNTGGSSRPLPDPATYQSPPTPQNRTGRFLASNPAPKSPAAPQTYSREIGSSAEERDAEDRRRQQSQAKTKAGGWAGKSLLEREMEMERERQREWEEAQKETARAVPSGEGVDGIGGGMGGRWDVGQWSGYTGGDSQNRGNQGIGAGRRQIVGPRPLPGSNR